MHFGGVDVAELAEKFGTPLIVTDERILRENFRAYVRAFNALKDELSDIIEDFEICYAVKANGSLAILRILAQEGAGADVVSGCELQAALLAGIPSEKIIFNGNAKSDEELKLAIETGVRVCLDSLDEADALSELADIHSQNQARNTQKIEVLVRVNPDISAKTHPKIATALKHSKFGIPSSEIFDACRYISQRKWLELRGIHCHIGSQILDVRVFKEAADKMLRIASHLQREGFRMEFIDLGGGLGIKYEEEQQAPTPHDLADAICEAFRDADLRESVKLIVEPGRSIVGNASILVTRVNAVKRTAERNFAAVDAGFNILIRPAMYGAYHRISACTGCDSDKSCNFGDSRSASTAEGADEKRAGESGGESEGGSGETLEEYTVVGPLCESGDILGERRKLPRLRRGDILIVHDVGAYGFSMSSQYNMRPRCAEVLVCDGRAELIRERETFGDLIRHQIIPPRLLRP